MPTETRSRPEYDLPTAVTFLIFGLAIGSVLARLFAPLRIDRDSPMSEDRPR